MNTLVLHQTPAWAQSFLQIFSSFKTQLFIFWLDSVFFFHLKMPSPNGSFYPQSDRKHNKNLIGECLIAYDNFAISHAIRW